MNIDSNEVWRLKESATACQNCSREGGPVVTNWSWSTLDKKAVVCLGSFSLEGQEAILKRPTAEATVREGYNKQQQEYTCYDCLERDDCEFAFDDYNKEGDCLADK